MKIYIANAYRSGVFKSALWPMLPENMQNKLLTYPYKLESYHYIAKELSTYNTIKKSGNKIFLDSGAFSAFTQGIEINLNSYADFILKNQDIIEIASVLDGIGDPELTLKNQKQLEKKNVVILPCFHYGEKEQYLIDYINKYDHITLGGMVPISTNNLILWLDEIWDKYLTDEDGYPKIKVHGFGLTSLYLMDRYPWHSVDSTSWVMTAQFGSCYLPTINNQNNKITFSLKSPNTKRIGQHYDTLSQIEQDAINSRIVQCGYTIDNLREQYAYRDLWNIDYFRGLCDQPMKPFIKKEMSIF